MSDTTVEQFQYQHRLRREAGSFPLPRLVCNDGFSVSVQAHEYCYATPRQTGCHTYSHFELGFPSAKEELLMPYVETASDPTGTVYIRVPVAVIVEVINNHGGLDLPQ